MRDGDIPLLGAFLPDSDQHLVGDAIRRFAHGVLVAALLRMVRWAVADSEANCHATASLVHELTDPAWRDDHVAAIRHLRDRIRKWEHDVAQLRTLGVPTDEIAPRGVHSRYFQAFGLFMRYHDALVSARVATKREREEVDAMRKEWEAEEEQREAEEEQLAAAGAAA